jgi:hypothetical protein
MKLSPVLDEGGHLLGLDSRRMRQGRLLSRGSFAEQHRVPDRTVQLNAIPDTGHDQQPACQSTH